MLLTIHHACCTGGSIISQILASATNSILISEINPFQSIRDKRIEPFFDPTAILWHLVYNSKEISNTHKLKYFFCQLDISIEHAKGLQKNLLLRDHTHSTFNFSDKDILFMNKKLGSQFLETIRYFYALKSKDFDFIQIKPIISIRHPLDSFIAARKKGWLLPYCGGGEINLENYCKGILKFQNYMEKEKSAKVIRYEDICINISDCLKKTFFDLNIDYQIPSLDEINLIKVTGKSGRKTENISLRERLIEDVDNELKNQIEVSKYYKEYCKLNKYNPNFQDYQIIKST